MNLTKIRTKHLIHNFDTFGYLPTNDFRFIIITLSIFAENMIKQLLHTQFKRYEIDSKSIYRINYISTVLISIYSYEYWNEHPRLRLTWKFFLECRNDKIIIGKMFILFVPWHDLLRIRSCMILLPWVKCCLLQMLMPIHNFWIASLTCNS